MRWSAALALAALLVLACSKKAEKERPRLTRSGDAAPVVLVDRLAPGGGRAMAAGGPRVEEVEPNDEPKQATPIPIPATASGVLDGETDVDLFRIVPEEGGALRAELSGAEGVDLVLELRDASGKRLARSDRGPAGVLEGIPNYRVEPGTTYLLAVSEFVRKQKKRQPRVGASAPYELRVEVAAEPAAGYEREPNDTAEGALELLLDDEGFGYIGWTDDVDLWRLSLAGYSDGYSLDLSVEGVDGVTLAVEVLDEEGQVIVRREGLPSQPVFVRNLVPRTGQAHHLARISGRRSNPLTPYVVRAGSRMLEADDEREPNDTAEQATPLRSGPDQRQGVRRGYLEPGDRDYYRVDAGAEAVALDVELLPPPGTDGILEVRAEGVTHKADDGKHGAAERLSGIRVGAGKTAYVRVTGTSRGDKLAPYELRWSLATDAPPRLEGDSGDDGDGWDF